MDYKRKILEMLQQIDDEKVLFIYLQDHFQPYGLGGLPLVFFLGILCEFFRNLLKHSPLTFIQFG